MERQKCEQWKCGIVSSDLCAKENLIRTQFVVKRENELLYCCKNVRKVHIIVNIVETGLQS